MPSLRLGPTRSVADLSIVGLAGSPDTKAPIAITPPISRPCGPRPAAGDPAWRLNHSRKIWALAQLVNFVSAKLGMYFSLASPPIFPEPGPDHGSGKRLRTNVTRVSFET